MQSTKTYATGLIRPKTTALFFDKLWVPDNLRNPFFNTEIAILNVPLSIKLEQPIFIHEYERAWGINARVSISQKTIKKYERQYPFLGISKELYKYLREQERRSNEGPTNNFENEYVRPSNFRDDRDLQYDIVQSWLESIPTSNRNRIINKLVEAYAKIGIELVPVYFDPKQYEYQTTTFLNRFTKTRRGLEICLDYIPDIAEKYLEWEQVIEFRNDSASREKLTRLRRWFNIELLHKSEEEITRVCMQNRK